MIQADAGITFDEVVRAATTGSGCRVPVDEHELLLWREKWLTTEEEVAIEAGADHQYAVRHRQGQGAVEQTVQGKRVVIGKQPPGCASRDRGDSSLIHVTAQGRTGP
ncbi:MAG TPA: hypothetical protein VMW80_07220 [Candidatus Dormibacteraeota bacterium]|nr:hypothetical protein [Candidatus Dormibacteraeota bacterium]